MCLCVHIISNVFLPVCTDGVHGGEEDLLLWLHGREQQPVPQCSEVSQWCRGPGCQVFARIPAQCVLTELFQTWWHFIWEVLVMHARTFFVCVYTFVLFDSPVRMWFWDETNICCEWYFIFLWDFFWGGRGRGSMCYISLCFSAGTVCSVCIVVFKLNCTNPVQQVFHVFFCYLYICHMLLFTWIWEWIITILFMLIILLMSTLC